MPVKTIEDQLADANEVIRQKNTKLLLLRKQLTEQHRENDTAISIKEEIFNLSTLAPDPPEWLTNPSDPSLPGVPMTLWSDWHWGERVDRAQVGGVNEFNREIANKRVRRLVQILLDLVKGHMVRPEYPGMVICLGGDMITGAIHEELMATNDGPVQLSVLEVEEALIWAIKILHENFGKLYIPCVVGNHGRDTIKPRMKNRVFQNYEWTIYQNLKRYFSERYSDIVFDIPDETDCHFNVLGHRFTLTHGDTLGVRGGDGIIGVIGPVVRGTTKVGRSEAVIGRDFDTLLMGHWHTYIPRGDAFPGLVNGSLIGYNEYARLGLRVPYSRPSQALWFMHQQHGFTAQWPIYLDNLRQSSDMKEWVTWQQNKRGA